MFLSDINGHKLYTSSSNGNDNDNDYDNDIFNGSSNGSTYQFLLLSGYTMLLRILRSTGSTSYFGIDVNNDDLHVPSLQLVN